MKKRFKTIKYVFFSLFALVCIYLIYFNVFQSRIVASNSYNRRLRDTGGNVIRGGFTDRKGEELVKSVRNQNGSIKRKYVYGRYFSHIIGYTNAKYGSSGLEALYNKELMSTSDTMENLRSKVNDYYVQGNSIKLTVDRSLQTYAADLLSGKKGSIVVIKPDTGEVLAMVSKPDYNPTDIQNRWDELTKDKNSPLLSRATEGLYPPGSIFKLVPASRLIGSGKADSTAVCTGSVEIGGYVIKDSGGESHGELDLKNALSVSCNSYFIKQGLSLGIQSLYEEATKFRFNKPISSDLRISQSVFPLKSDEKSVAQQSIGQGGVLITPMHAALIAAAIANKGVMMQPYTVDSVTDGSGKTLKAFKPKQLGQIMKSETAEQLTEMMINVVNKGTGTRAKISGIKVAGKTGTAEVSGGKSHAWFVGFAPADHPRAAIAVIIENGGSGGSTAAPIAGKVLKKALSVIK